MRNKPVAVSDLWQHSLAGTWLGSLCMASIAAVRPGLRRTRKNRYQHFVQLNPEAVWCIELQTPMPPGLSMERQIAWLRERARIAECNPAYRRLAQAYGLAEAETQRFRFDVPWAAIYIKHFEQAARQRYSLAELQFSIFVDGQPVNYAATFTAVMEGKRLARIWGMARDVTGVAQKAGRFERERLREYAWMLGQAEEQVRRSVAVDLHDGVGQLLVALQLNLSAARSAPVHKAKQLVAEAEATLAQIQVLTHDVITDLSPPGLYEFGLNVALEWLASRVAERDGLKLLLSVRVPEHALDIEWQVFVFKIVRELVQNAAKHAQVKTVRVHVAVDRERLDICVADEGVGFAVAAGEARANGHGFGLSSVADRVRAAGGRFQIKSAPGRGCRVTVRVPTPTRQRAEAVESVGAGNHRVKTSDCSAAAAP